MTPLNAMQGWLATCTVWNYFCVRWRGLLFYRSKHTTTPPTISKRLIQRRIKHNWGLEGSNIPGVYRDGQPVHLIILFHVTSARPQNQEASFHQHPLSDPPARCWMDRQHALQCWCVMWAVLKPVSRAIKGVCCTGQNNNTIFKRLIRRRLNDS